MNADPLRYTPPGVGSLADPMNRRELARKLGRLWEMGVWIGEMREASAFHQLQLRVAEGLKRPEDLLTGKEMKEISWGLQQIACVLCDCVPVEWGEECGVMAKRALAETQRKRMTEGDSP